MPSHASVSSTSSLFHLLCLSSGCSQTRRFKPVAVGVFSFPREMISPGGFAGVALRRCLCRSGQYSASTVSPMSPLAAALVRISPSCSKLKRLFETHCRGLLSRFLGRVSPPVSPAVKSSGSSVLQASEGSWSLSSASLGVLLLESLVLCSCGGTRVQPLNLCFHQPIATSGVDFIACVGRTRACRPCFACPSFDVAFGMVCASLERWQGRGEPDLSWRHRQAGRPRVSHGVDLGQISPGGFAGVALRRCLCRSGQYSASTVSPMSPLAAALVRTSPFCSKLKRRFEANRRGLLSRFLRRVSPPVLPAVRSSGSSVLQASEGSWSLYSASLGVMLLESLVLCSRDGTRVKPLNLCFHQPFLEIATSGVDFIACDVRTRACQPCFVCPSFDVALGMVCGASDRSPVAILYWPERF
ncbi:hypothetical protein F2Q68_00019745 [Brassica cretica]|uniref:Uncharacterized protein n=1 Tax=Brassica cretica TaxID=69181 RepID=A0A8S9FYT2_BRACR|nr:hypothetical protein F2Q68_00019745 [Brassica cretica]